VKMPGLFWRLEHRNCPFSASRVLENIQPLFLFSAV
jgi:hypothetical protein